MCPAMGIGAALLLSLLTYASFKFGYKKKKTCTSAILGQLGTIMDIYTSKRANGWTYAACVPPSSRRSFRMIFA